MDLPIESEGVTTNRNRLVFDIDFSRMVPGDYVVENLSKP